MGEVVNIKPTETKRVIHEVPPDFNPASGLFLDDREHGEAQAALFICESTLRMFHGHCWEKANDRDQGLIDIANVVTTIQCQLKVIGDLLGK